MLIELQEFYVNIKNWDFDIKQKYTLDENEAKKIMKAIERLKEIEQCKKHLRGDKNDNRKR